jgi:hypothetical protein
MSEFYDYVIFGTNGVLQCHNMLERALLVTRFQAVGQVSLKSLHKNQAICSMFSMKPNL